ncbi:MAG: YHYH protein, partial [Actinomycetota bacterium]
MTNACRRCVVAIAVLTWVVLASACTGDDDPIDSLALDATADTAPPQPATAADSTVSAVAGPAHLGDYTSTDATFGTEVTVTIDQGLRIIEANALPDHSTGRFPNPGNPNTIAGQELRYEFPTAPRFLGRAQPARMPAVAINGVPFEPGTAEVVECASGERYQIEALQGLYDLGLDNNRVRAVDRDLLAPIGATGA